MKCHKWEETGRKFIRFDIVSVVFEEIPTTMTFTPVD
jgi:hypothetical protein